MSNARCFLSRQEQSLDALSELLSQLETQQLSTDGVGILLASEHHRAQAEKLRSTLATEAKLSALTGTITRAGLVGKEAFFGESFLVLLRWEPEPANSPRPLQLSRLGDHNLDSTLEAAMILSSSTTAHAVLESASVHDIFTLGAITFAAEPTLQFHSDGSIIAGATGLGWNDSSSIATVLIPGAEDLSPPLEVTAAHQDIVIELEGRPAVDVLCEILGIDTVAAFETIGTQYLIGIEHNAHDYSQRVYRHIRALDPNQRMFSIDHTVSKGDRLTIGRRSRESASKLIHKHTKEFVARLADRSLQAIVFQGCIARGPAVFDDANEEATLIAHYFPEIPLIGTYGNGEFFGQELQSYAAVLTAILE